VEELIQLLQEEEKTEAITAIQEVADLIDAYDFDGAESRLALLTG